MTSEISAAIASLRAASDIAKAMLGLNETIAIQAKVFELQAAILSAQQSALDANSAQSTLLERISGLEEELADLKTWDGEKQKYQLTEVGPGAFAFSLKPDSGSTEPAHSLCSNCYHDGRKAILQARRSNAKDILACLRCKEVIVVRNHVPMPPARVGASELSHRANRRASNGGRPALAGEEDEASAGLRKRTGGRCAWPKGIGPGWQCGDVPEKMKRTDRDVFLFIFTGTSPTHPLSGWTPRSREC